MNDYKLDGLEERLNNAQLTKLRPLVMKTLNPTGQEIKAIAINEISIRREKYQAAKIQIMIDNEVRIEELVCDGVILSTAAGSTGYNYSASGPIIPLGSNVVALTAVSAYSPRHWRGGLLKDNAKIKIINNNPSKRPIVVHADHIEAQEKLIKKYGNYEPEEADFIVALGGDGFILKSLHNYMKLNKPIYGMNFGSVGFLMNDYKLDGLELSLIHI